jgi:hypothetical protein
VGLVLRRPLTLVAPALTKKRAAMSAREHEKGDCNGPVSDFRQGSRLDAGGVMSRLPDRPSPTSLDLSHLRRETRTALELAVAALAPEGLIDRLATVAGLFEALAELPEGTPPVIALTPKLVSRSKEALKEWDKWRAEYLAHVKA